MPTDARSAILARIRSANQGATEATAAHNAFTQIPRAYTQASSASREAILALLTERLHDYDAEVIRCGAHEVPQLAERVLGARGVTRLLVPEGFPPELLPCRPQATWDRGFTPTELDSFAAAMTQSTLAIAETGTLVLRGVPGQGRRAVTLVPDVHLCLVHTADVVATVPEAFARLGSAPELPITFVSGPSATADIEMTRIKGVHGPRFLHVFLIEDAGA